MRYIELDTYIDANLEVTGQHFGGNVLYTRNTQAGNPDPNYVMAVDELDIQYIRYPAGQPDVAYIDGVIVDGYLPDHLVNFLESARENGWQVLIVTPTHEAYPGADLIGDFAELIVRDFSDVVHAFEIGNEYWNHQTETSYGQVANDSVLEIADGLRAAGVDKPIWVQMGDAGGWESEFHARNDDRGWLTRTIEANDTIIDQISGEAFAEIDGVVEHFYLRGGDQFIDTSSLNDQMIGLDYSIWKNYVGENATLNITEWNIRSSNLDQLGIRAASSLVAHFSHIVELGADEAYLWPPHLNTSSDLAGSNEVLVDQETGVVINSVGGAVFDLMSSSLPGLEYLPSGVTGDSQRIVHHLYGGNDRAVVYLSSRSEEIETVHYSLGEYFQGFVLTSALRIGYDSSTSDGRHYNYRTRSWDQSEVITVLGEDYVINEHDVQATVEALDVSSQMPNEYYEVELLPYQVVELVFEVPDFNVIEGSDSRDIISGSDEDDWILLFNGADSVTAGDGSDTISGGLGDDYINSGSGNDSVEAGDGDDSIRGWGGDDSLFGNAGADDIKGSFGRDVIFGGSGDDTLFGGDWNDTLYGGLGDDLLFGGNGQDWLVTGEGQDTLDGGPGRDTMSFEEAGEGVTVWTGWQTVEIGMDIVQFSNFEVVRATGFSDRITVLVDDMEFVGLGGNDFFDISDGFENTVYAGDGDDKIFVFSGYSNSLHGGAGRDYFLILEGGNEVTGGIGDDKFVFNNSKPDIFHYDQGDGSDVVSGFDYSEDKVYLGRELQDQTSIQNSLESTNIIFDGGGSIEFEGIAGLTMDSIVFV